MEFLYTIGLKWYQCTIKYYTYKTFHVSPKVTTQTDTYRSHTDKKEREIKAYQYKNTQQRQRKKAGEEKTDKRTTRSTEKS